MRETIFYKSGCVAAIFVFSTLFLSCGEDDRETFTKGKLTVISSEDIFPVFDKEVAEFQRIYEKAKIVHYSATAREAIVHLLNDSVKVIACSRDLNDEEKAVIAKDNLNVESHMVAYDCVVVFVNEKNSLARCTVAQLKDILLGNIRSWRELGDKKNGGSIVVAMGDANSGVQEYIKNRVAGGVKLAPVVYPCSTSARVISFVQNNANAIGFVGMSWAEKTPVHTRILDIGDPAFTRDSTSKELEYFSPIQAYVYRNYYPLRRSLYLFSKNIGSGVGAGLITFIATSQGQKIFLTNGLVPAKVPVKLVQLTQ